MENKITSRWERFKSVFQNPVVEQKPVEQPKAFMGGGAGQWNFVGATGYNGEKNLGELGPIKNYYMQYDILRLRSWQSYMESEITQTVIHRYITWVIGKGLKLQSEPAKKILAMEGVELDATKFSESVEGRFNIFRKSKQVDYSGMLSLDMLAGEAFKNAIVGGDVLVVLRYVNNKVTVQLIDGAHVQSQNYGTELVPYVLPNGNRIMNGVEVNQRREVVAYYVRSWQEPNKMFTYERIPAKIEGMNLECAFLVKGLNYRLDNVRGLPLISAVLESLKKMERYKEATIGSAEERQKIVYAVEHDVTSTGENPLIKQVASAYGQDGGKDGDLPITVQNEQLANKVASTTEKQAYNMPIGSKLKVLESKNELYFKDFYTVNIELICATLGIPPNVAMSKYNDSFSASRAALKDWENTLMVDRNRYQFYFYQPIYNFWLQIQILQNKVSAPGYLEAMMKDDDMVLGAYRNARFVGTPVPHIDPVKEVTAERLKLGDTGASIPLTTVEAATENLGGGDHDSNMEQYATELDKSKSLGIKMEVVQPAPANGNTKKETEED